MAVDALDDWIARLGIDDCRSFGDDPTKTFTPWRGRHALTRVSRESGGVIPYLIEYDRSVDLDAIFTAKHLAARHDAVVGQIRRVVTDGRHITSIVVDLDGRDMTLPLP